MTPKIITSKSIFNLVVFNKDGNWEMSILELIPTDENLIALEQGITEEFEGTLKNVYDSSVTETNTIGARVVIKFHCPNLYPCGNGYCDMCLSHCLTIVTFDEPRSFGIDYVIPDWDNNGGAESSHSGGGAVDIENIINNPVFSDPTGYFFDPNMPPVGINEYFRNREASAFWNSLSEGVNGEKAWANQHPEEYSEIIEFYLDNFSEENEELANELIDQMVLNPELDLDIDASSKSPANIDLNVQDTTAAAVKLRCLYSKLTLSQSFKDLFLNTFGVNNRINVSLEVVDDLPQNVNGNCQMFETNTNGVTSYVNKIKIKRSNLEENNIDSKSNIYMVRVILHEFLHAYLNIKRKNCDAGASLPYLNNLELDELIIDYYQNFNCEINVEGSPQSQHSFMFDYMVPTFQQILAETRDLLMPQSHINTASEITFVNTNLNINEPWDWENYYRYMSLIGLHNCQSYQQTISGDPVETFLFDAYNVHTNYFSKSCN